MQYSWRERGLDQQLIFTNTGAVQYLSPPSFGYMSPGDKLNKERVSETQGVGFEPA